MLLFQRDSNPFSFLQRFTKNLLLFLERLCIKVVWNACYKMDRYIFFLACHACSSFCVLDPHKFTRKKDFGCRPFFKGIYFKRVYYSHYPSPCVSLVPAFHSEKIFFFFHFLLQTRYIHEYVALTCDYDKR